MSQSSTLVYNYDIDPTYNAAQIIHYVIPTLTLVLFHYVYGLPALKWKGERATSFAYLILFFTFLGAGGNYGLIYLQQYPCGQFVSAISTAVAFFVAAWLPRWHFGSQLCSIIDKMMVRYADRSAMDRFSYTLLWAGPCFMLAVSSLQVSNDVIELKFGGFGNLFATCMQTGAVGRDGTPISNLTVLVAILGPAILVPFQFWMFSRAVRALRHDRERLRTIRIARFCFTLTFICNLFSSLVTVFGNGLKNFRPFATFMTYWGSLLGVILPFAIQKSVFWEYVVVGKALSRSSGKFDSSKKESLSVSLHSTTKLPVKTVEDVEDTASHRVTS